MLFSLNNKTLSHDFFSTLLPVTFRIAPVVKKRGIMNSNNKNDHKVHMTVLCNIKDCSGLYRIWAALDDLITKAPRHFCILNIMRG